MLFDKLMILFTANDPSDYEDYFEDTSWKTFRLDENIWNENGTKRPGIAYYRELQVCYEQLLKEMSNSYLYDVSGLKEQFNAMHLRNCTLERELAIAKGENEILQRQLTDALKWQTQNGRKNEVFESNGLEVVVTQATAKGTSSGKFTSKNGASHQENQMLVAAYFENKWSLKEICEELELSEATVKTYISNMRKHYQVQYIQGRRYITFDSEYGDNQWDLALYERLSTKFPNIKADAS